MEPSDRPKVTYCGHPALMLFSSQLPCVLSSAGRSWNLFNPAHVGFFFCNRLGSRLVYELAHSKTYTVVVCSGCDLTGEVLWIAECVCRKFTTRAF